MFLPRSDAVGSISAPHTCSDKLYCALLGLICTVKHAVAMAMVRPYSESLVCLLDGFLALSGALTCVGAVRAVDSMTAQQMFSAPWRGSIPDQSLHSTV